jgi:hypothetical protein
MSALNDTSDTTTASNDVQNLAIVSLIFIGTLLNKPRLPEIENACMHASKHAFYFPLHGLKLMVPWLLVGIAVVVLVVGIAGAKRARFLTGSDMSVRICRSAWKMAVGP